MIPFFLFYQTNKAIFIYFLAEPSSYKASFQKFTFQVEKVLFNLSSSFNQYKLN